MSSQGYVLIGKDTPLPRLSVQTAVGSFEPVAKRTLEVLGQDFDDSQHYRFVVIGLHATVSDPKNYVGVRSIGYHPLEKGVDGRTVEPYWSERNSYPKNPEKLADLALSYLGEIQNPYLLIEEVVEEVAVDALNKRGLAVNNVGKI